MLIHRTATRAVRNVCGGLSNLADKKKQPTDTIYVSEVRRSLMEPLLQSAPVSVATCWFAITVCFDTERAASASKLSTGETGVRFNSED